MADDIPLSLYLHFPWCVQKCPYCDFNSHAVRGDLPEDAYIDALIRDLDFELADRPEKRPLQSIFMGGGTPSLFSAAAIGRLLTTVSSRLPFAQDIEITLEANPGTAEHGHFAGYRSAGVNRLSMGVQSFNDAHLQRLGRIHDHREAIQAVTLARQAGFDNLNLDLMYALPEQTPEQAAHDLKAAFSLAPEHLSYYQLTLEPNTAFAANPPPLPDDDAAWALHEQGAAMLAQAGYQAYEISATAQPGRQSRHNLNYWRFGDYLGIGAGAHGKRTVFRDGHLRIERRARHKLPRTFLAGAGTAAAVQSSETVASSDHLFEFLMNTLRLNEPFSRQTFQQCTGHAWPEAHPAVREAVRRGWLTQDAEQVGATDTGRIYLNALLRLFLETTDA